LDPKKYGKEKRAVGLRYMIDYCEDKDDFDTWMCKRCGRIVYLHNEESPGILKYCSVSGCRLGGEEVEIGTVTFGYEDNGGSLGCSGCGFKIVNKHIDGLYVHMGYCTSCGGRVVKNS